MRINKLFIPIWVCLSFAAYGQHNPYLGPIQLFPVQSPERDTGFYDCGDTLSATYTLGINGSSVVDYEVCGAGLQIKMYVGNAQFLFPEDASMNVTIGPEAIGIFSFEFSGPDTIVATQIAVIPYSFFNPFETQITVSMQVLPTADLGQPITIGAYLVVPPPDQVCFGNLPEDDSIVTIQTVFCSQPLPLQAIDLRTKLMDKSSAKITWKILHQINYVEFELERKKDNQTGWTSIATMPANHHVENEVEYNYIDHFQGSADKLYYRIKILDKNGQYDYSPVQVLLLQTGHFRLSGYPNPTAAFYELNIQSRGAEKIAVQVLDILGRLVYQEGFGLKEGNTTRRLDFSALRPGNYFIKVSGTDIRETLNVVKME